ncbi:oxidoreductase [Streptosporangium lutulentum]|uniref:NAD(P)-dependent dehydrogenase (Short-subunit alcohol dehydrogenase family) n=1 Tax=Streptosporangium lutulentum TaxID=1461250 RepID=A0ABT9QQJ5_9ACTN|nr:oxidoreductase [Streptosporangium lutulentum]MDP9848690.1 NAD(P)-dependent dehydrogenase (short-subunit alcohol dehydrogenase family) [Streptosporangium lutulentum]
MERWTADNIPDQAGRTFVVTGANSGLGLETTRELVRRGAKVIMAVRDPGRGRKALDELSAEQPKGALELRPLDLSDLDSVRSFAEAVIADGTPVDVLVNNAGVMMCPRTSTKQGFELQFATNHLGHFALTGLLLGTLRAARDARVVTVSSGLHRRGVIDFDDINGERKYSPSGAYAQSKLANVLFALELDRRVRAAGIPVKSILAHPGYSATNLQSSGPTGLLNLLMKISNRLVAQDVRMGALNQLYAATDPNAATGQFIGPDGRGESKGHPTLVRPSEAGQDVEVARRLWDLSERLTGVRFDLAGD